MEEEWQKLKVISLNFWPPVNCYSVVLGLHGSWGQGGVSFFGWGRWMDEAGPPEDRCRLGMICGERSRHVVRNTEYNLVDAACVCYWGNIRSLSITVTMHGKYSVVDPPKWPPNNCLPCS